MSVRIGYKASAEQFGPRELLEFSREAERHGLEIVAVSDHFQPWRHNGGHAPAAMPWLAALGQASERAVLGTSVLTPTLRYHPSMVAQAFATLGSLSPGRVFLGIGSGEAMNETPATGQEFPGRKERRLRLAEAVELLRLLWSQERVDFAGDYYQVSRATIYDRPDQPVPIYIAASGPLAAKLAGRVGDGFICTSGKSPELYENLLTSMSEGARGAGRDPSAVRRMIEIKVSYDRDLDYAFKACEWWAALALSPEQKEGVEDPVEMERLADENAHRAHTRFIVSNDPAEVIQKIGGYLDLGFDDLVLHAPGADQSRFIEQFSEDVMPALRSHAELTRLRYVTEILAWMGGHQSWSQETIAEQIDASDGARISGDLAAAEREGLLDRRDGGLRLTELGWRVAQGFGEALQADGEVERSERVHQVAADATPAISTNGDALSVRYLAEVLVWIGGDALWPTDTVISTVGEEQRARVIRDLELAERSGVVLREPGGIRLTNRGWSLAAGDDE
jgi:coenzyme F420-dependent glucose-6-phosphate dehydrogenase